MPKQYESIASGLLHLQICRKMRLLYPTLLRSRIPEFFASFSPSSSSLFFNPSILVKELPNLPISFEYFSSASWLPSNSWIFDRIRPVSAKHILFSYQSPSLVSNSPISFSDKVPGKVPTNVFIRGEGGRGFRFISTSTIPFSQTDCHSKLKNLAVSAKSLSVPRKELLSVLISTPSVPFSDTNVKSQLRNLFIPAKRFSVSRKCQKNRDLESQSLCSRTEILGRLSDRSLPNSVKFFSVASKEKHIRNFEEREGIAPWQGPKVHLNGFQQIAVAVSSAVGAFMNPARADLVAALGETTGSLAFARLLERMQWSVEGKKVLADRPRVTSSRMAKAWDMPPNTFGAAYAKFMKDRNFSPDDRPPVRYIDSEDIAYIATRSREIHDFWHVLFNLPTSVMGELALKMVEFHQTGIPMCFLSVTGGSWRLKPEQRKLLFTHYAPWALEAGAAASDLMCIYYEQHLEEDLDAVRKKWGILPAPPLPKKQAL